MKCYKLSTNTLCIFILFPAILVSALILISFTLKQKNQHNDCKNAHPICALGDYYISNIQGPGAYEDLKTPHSNLEETNSHWFTFDIATPGEMEFVIIPDRLQDDIDFVLYDGGSCEEKHPIRTMTTGQILGQESRQECVGQTGLQRFSSDISEFDGCLNFSDNFLKPVALEKGRSYHLLVNNFNATGGFTILFTGDENLKLQDKCNNNLEQNLEMTLYPNPTVDAITLAPSQPSEEATTIQIFDQSGKIFFVQDRERFETQFSIDVSNYPSGKYFLRASTSSHVYLESFVKM